MHSFDRVRIVCFLSSRVVRSHRRPKPSNWADDVPVTNLRQPSAPQDPQDQIRVFLQRHWVSVCTAALKHPEAQELKHASILIETFVADRTWVQPINNPSRTHPPLPGAPPTSQRTLSYAARARANLCPVTGRQCRQTTKSRRPPVLSDAEKANEQQSPHSTKNVLRINPFRRDVYSPADRAFRSTKMSYFAPRKRLDTWASAISGSIEFMKSRP